MFASRAFAALLFLLLAAAIAAPAQQEGDTDTQPVPPDAPPGWTPPPPFEDNRDQQRGHSSHFQGGPSSVTGSVKRADGKPLPDDAVVEVLCQGQSIAAGTTRGRFQLAVVQPRELGDLPGQDVSEGLTRCELRARLSGFQEATVTLGTLSPGGLEIGWVVLHPLHDASGFSYTATTAMAPKDARKAWEKGRELLAQGKHKAAVPLLRKATELYPRFAMAWFELGTAYHQLGESEEARKAYAAAIEADRLYLPPYLQMAMLAATHRAWPVVESLATEVIRRNSYEFPQAFLYHAAASYNLGKINAAEISARRAIELDAPGRLPRAHLLLARILLETNRRAEAQPVLARYLELTEGKPEAEEARALLRSQPAEGNPFVAVPGSR